LQPNLATEVENYSPTPFYRFNNTMRRLLILLAATALLLTGGCATLKGAPRPEPPTSEQVVRMSQEGKSAEDIIKLMKDSRAVYELPASQLADLRQRGVADKVIDYMQATYLEQARYEEALRRPYYYGPHYGPWGYWGPVHPRYRGRYWYGSPYWHPYW
jgi:hypothetical protein